MLPMFKPLFGFSPALICLLLRCRLGSSGMGGSGMVVVIESGMGGPPLGRYGGPPPGGGMGGGNPESGMGWFRRAGCINGIVGAIDTIYLKLRAKYCESQATETLNREYSQLLEKLFREHEMFSNSETDMMTAGDFNIDSNKWFDFVLQQTTSPIIMKDPELVSG